MLTRSKKENIVKDLDDRFSRKKIAIFTNFHGISVSRAQILRRALKKDAAEYKVARKTLVDLALKNAGLDTSVKNLKAEVGIAFGYDDPSAPAKTLVKFCRENESFTVLGGILGGKIIAAGDVLMLARLPSREALLSQVVGALESPLRGLAAALGGNIKNLVVVLNRVKEKR